MTTIPPRVRIDWRRPGGRKPPGVVVCSRPGKWGNPWRVEYVAERGRYCVYGPGDLVPAFMGRTDADAYCLENYRRWLAMQLDRDPTFLDPLRTATGLACYCGEADACHVDVLREILAEDVTR